MKKKTLTIAFLLDGIMCLVFLALTIYENQNASFGMAALTSLGRWVIYAVVFIITFIIFVILGAIIIWNKHKNK